MRGAKAAGEQEAAADSQGDAHEEQPHCRASPLLGKEFSQQGHRGGYQGRLAAGNEKARDDHLLEALRMTRGQRADAPDQHAGGDDAGTAEAVRQGSHEHRHHAEAQYPHRADQKAILGIAERQILDDLRREAEQHVAVDMRQQVDHQQRRQNGRGAFFPEHHLSPCLRGVGCQRGAMPYAAALRLVTLCQAALRADPPPLHGRPVRYHAKVLQRLVDGTPLGADLVDAVGILAAWRRRD